MTTPGIPRAGLDFLRELSLNNTREWFQANKARYERDLRDPALALVTALAAPLRRLSTALVVDPRPVGGSMFRIQRDTRFAKDKRPYKTHTGLLFWHGPIAVARGKLVGPAFYVHLEPGTLFVGGGIFQPEPGVLAAWRARVLEAPDEWIEAKASLRGATLMAHEGYKRNPAGVPAGHPLEQDLRMKHLAVEAPLSEEDVHGARCVEVIAEACAGMSRYNAWLCDVMGFTW